MIIGIILSLSAGAIIGMLVMGLISTSATSSRISDIANYYQMQSKKVYVVTLWYDDAATEPVVTVFKTEEQARRMVRHYLQHLKEGSLAPDHVCMDECQVFNIINTPEEYED